MIISFFSNYFNHHQKALCDALYAIDGVDFYFVETQPMEEFRKNMGWGVENLPSYVINSYENDEKRAEAINLSLRSDLVIIGSAPEEYIKQRLEENKLIFRYTERPLKEGIIKKYIPRLHKKYKEMHYKNRDKNIYVLGASAYASYDYKLLNSYEGRVLKFGYFPEGEKLSWDDIAVKKSNAGKPVSILWTGRFLKLKHPELLVKALHKISMDGIQFDATFVGDGPEKNNVKKLTEKYSLEDKIHFMDFVKPEEVREMMRCADIYVCTSNHLEGWGSVVYEGATSGCAVIASHLCGSAPFLVLPGKTGYLFKSGSVNSLYEKLRCLISDRDKLRNCGKGAYENMQKLWNPEVAACRIVNFAKAVQAGSPIEYEDGPLSITPVLKNNWYKE